MESVLPIPRRIVLDPELLRHIVVLAAVSAAVACIAVFRPGFGGPLTYVVVAGDSMLPALQGGDVVFTWRQPAYEVGDVIAYRVPEGEPGAGILVIHRITGGSAAKGYVVRGDNKDGVDPWQPAPSDVVGKAKWRLPRVGLAIAFMRSPLGIALIAGIVTFAIAMGGSQDERKEGDTRAARRAAVALSSVWLRIVLLALSALPALALAYLLG